MQIRTNKVLLTIMLTALNKLTRCTGLCHLITTMWRNHLIKDKEYYKLYRYIAKHRPNKNNGSAYSWPVGDKPPRIEWLKQQIKLLP